MQPVFGMTTGEMRVQPLNLSTTIGDMEVVVELSAGNSNATVFVTMPGGIRVHHPLDVSTLLNAGLSTHEALNQTLNAVTTGIYCVGLRRA